MGDIRRSMSRAEFVKWSRWAGFLYLAIDTAILAAMAYWDVSVKWIVVAVFFLSTWSIFGNIREAVVRLDPERSGNPN